MREEILKRLRQILQEYNLKNLSSHQYDSLKTSKPCRKTIRKYFGSFKEAIRLATSELPDQSEEIERLRRTISKMARYLQTPKIVIPEDEVTFGIVSDTHFGSYYSDISLLNQAYEIFLKEKVDFVFHAGDLLDGEKMYRGHEYEIFVHGADNQVKYCIENYPSSGIKTYFIDGNHDRSFWRRAGVCTGERIASLRDDLVYLGYQEADVEFSKGMFIRVYHPEDGSAYALSYKPQRYISELSGKNKPQLLVVGHYHKAEKLFYRNIAVIQAGTLQRQTPYMRGKKISAAVGFWIVRLSVSKDILRIRSEFFNVDS